MEGRMGGRENSQVNDKINMYILEIMIIKVMLKIQFFCLLNNYNMGIWKIHYRQN